MADKQKRITTEADVLITLLRDVGEIPLKDAAKRLGVALPTLEAWTTFLEEEGIISVRYKFTTPYLSLAAKAAPAAGGNNDDTTFQRQLRSAEIQNEMHVLSRLLHDVHGQAKSGDFAKLPSSYDTLLSKLQHIQDFLFEKAADMLPGEKKSLQERFVHVRESLQRAHGLVDQGAFTEASRSYLQIHQQLSHLLGVLNSLYERASTSSSVPPQHADPQSLLDRAYAELRRGNFVAAREIQDMLRDYYQNLSHEYADRRHELERHLAKLSKDMSVTHDRHTIQRMQQGSRQITLLLQQLTAVLKVSDLPAAERLYARIKRSYDTLPSGFLDEKQRLQENIIRAYETILAVQQKTFATRLKETEQQCLLLINRMDDAIGNGNLDAAIALYGKGKASFEALPAGFLDEKLSLQSKLLAAYSRLMAAYGKHEEHDFRNDVTLIEQLLEQMKRAVQARNPAEAMKLYYQIRERYHHFPRGFLAEKTEMRHRILDVYAQLTKTSVAVTTADVKTKVSHLNRLLDEGFDYIKKKKYDLAAELYNQIIGIYNHLPSGFSQSKSMIRSRMLSLYKELVMHRDEPFRSDFSADAEKTYHDILRQIIGLHHHVARREFEFLEPVHHAILKLFKQLPVGFVEQKTQLSRMIAVIGKEVELHRMLLQLPGIAARKDVASLANALADIHTLKTAVQEESTESLELVRRAEQLHDQYVIRNKEAARRREQPLLPLPAHVPSQKASHLPSAAHLRASDASETHIQDLLEHDRFDELEQKIRELGRRVQPRVVVPQ